MKLINAPYKIQCQSCHKMVNRLTLKDGQLICLYCSNKNFLHINSHKPHTPREIRTLYKQFKKRNPGKKIYAVKGVISILHGGCIK